MPKHNEKFSLDLLRLQYSLSLLFYLKSYQRKLESWPALEQVGRGGHECC